MKKLDIFIPGETMDLCIPTLEFSRDSEWYSWFNDKKLNRFLEQGLFPNTPEMQEDFFLNAVQDRLILIVSNKEQYMGVVSLSNIDLVKRTCDIATVIDSLPDKRSSPYIALEAIARITEHAFEVMGINRIFAGQHIELTGWRQRMELLGYMAEGIHSNNFVKGREIADSITLACVYSTYSKLVKERGELWDGRDRFKERFRALPREDFIAKLQDYFNTERANYYNELFKL